MALFPRRCPGLYYRRLSGEQNFVALHQKIHCRVRLKTTAQFNYLEITRSFNAVEIAARSTLLK